MLAGRDLDERCGFHHASDAAAAAASGFPLHDYLATTTLRAGDEIDIIIIIIITRYEIEE